jgi:hypothetical protein
MRAPFPFLLPHASPASLAEIAENCVAFLIAKGRAPAPTPELRREVELHLWLDQLCDDAPAPRAQKISRHRRPRKRAAPLQTAQTA